MLQAATADTHEVAPTIYDSLRLMLDGAEAKGYERKHLGELLHPLLYPEPEYVNEQEAAKVLNRSVPTLRRWRMEGIGPEFEKRGNGRVYYRMADIRSFDVATVRFPKMSGPDIDEKGNPVELT